MSPLPSYPHVTGLPLHGGALSRALVLHCLVTCLSLHQALCSSKVWTHLTYLSIFHRSRAYGLPEVLQGVRGGRAKLLWVTFSLSMFPPSCTPSICSVTSSFYKWSPGISEVLGSRREQERTPGEERERGQINRPSPCSGLWGQLHWGALGGTPQGKPRRG